MRIIDARNKPPPQIDNIHRQYPPSHYSQIGTQYPHQTTDLDIREFRERAEKEGAVVIFISSYGQSAYIPLKELPSVPSVEPRIDKGSEYWHKVNLTQKAIMGRMKSTRVIEVHSDGDLTFENEQGQYVLTTKGEIFVGSPLYRPDRPGSMPQIIPDQDDLLKYYKVPPNAF